MGGPKRMRLSVVGADESWDVPPRPSSARASLQRTRTSLLPLYSFGLRRPDETCHALVDDDDQTDALLEYVIKPLWNVCRVSPLYNLKYDKPALKRYAEKMNRLLSEGIKSRGGCKYHCQVNVVNNMKIEMGHEDALQILVDRSTRDSSERKNVYEGLLFSWGDFVALKESDAVHLPLLLDRGPTKLAAAARHSLMKMFDTTISTINFKQNELILISALMSSFAPKEGTKDVKFVYDVPCTDSKTNIEISMSAEEIHNMWLDQFPNQSDSFDEQRSLKWYSAFRDHIKYVYEMNIAKLELTNLIYPNMTVQKNGKIKFNDVEKTKLLLRVLCDMSVILKGSIPKLACDYY